MLLDDSRPGSNEAARGDSGYQRNVADVGIPGGEREFSAESFLTCGLGCERSALRTVDRFRPLLRLGRPLVLGFLYYVGLRWTRVSTLRGVKCDHVTVVKAVRRLTGLWTHKSQRERPLRSVNGQSADFDVGARCAETTLLLTGLSRLSRKFTTHSPNIHERV